MLPQSHVLQNSLLNVYERPIAARGPYDVYEASFNGSKVWVKRLRIYSGEGAGDVTRVSFRDSGLDSFASHQPVGFLSRSRDLETFIPSKYRPSPWRDRLTLPVCFRLGIGR